MLYVEYFRLLSHTVQDFALQKTIVNNHIFVCVIVWWKAGIPIGSSWHICNGAKGDMRQFIIGIYFECRPHSSREINLMLRVIFFGTASCASDNFVLISYSEACQRLLLLDLDSAKTFWTTVGSAQAFFTSIITYFPSTMWQFFLFFA